MEIGDVVDAPASLAVLVHLVKQPVWSPTGSTTQAKLHIHHSQNPIGLRSAAAGYLCAKCFSLGIAEHIEINKATITHRLEFYGPQ